MQGPKKQGVNRGRQQTPPEERVCNVDPSPSQERDWLAENIFEDFAVSENGEDELTEDSEGEMALPASVDLTDGCNWWTVGDQGGTGSCVGWALADSVLRWHMVKANLISTREADRASVRYIWMAAKETDQFTQRPTTFIERSGTSLKAALDVARKYGVVKEHVLPFDLDQQELYLGKPEIFWSLAARLRVLLYVNLGAGPLDKLIKWKKWLAERGPILTRLNVDSTFDYSTGELDEYKPASARGGHAVAIVGYTTTTFKVRNSWGEDWGNGGYAEASFKYALSAFTEAYGVHVFGIPS